MTNKIILITDLHIKLDKMAMDIDTKSNFRKILSAIEKWDIDHLIIAGDICFQYPEQEVYNYVKTNLDQLKIPYSIINGNHDDPRMIVETFEMEEHFYEKENELYYTKLIGDRKFIFLDTQKGQISKTQLRWLKSELKHQKNSRPIIIMHYPPIISGVPHMDHYYSLSNMEEVQSIIYEHPESLPVFTGHYHVEKTIVSNNMSLFITPSCFVQIDQQDINFKPDHFQIAYRVIDFNKYEIQTSVHYLHKEGV